MFVPLPRPPDSPPARAVGAAPPNAYWFWHYARLFKLLDNGWHISTEKGQWASSPSPAGGCNVVHPISNPWNLDPFWYAQSSVRKAFQEWTYDWQTKLWSLCATYTNDEYT